MQAPKPENPKSAMVTQEPRPSGGSGYARSQGNDMSSGGGGGGYDQSGMGMGAGMSSMGMGGMQARLLTVLSVVPDEDFMPFQIDSEACC